MDYNLIFAESHSLESAIFLLKQKVKEQISYGWKLQGGVSITQSTEYGYYAVCQAVYK